MHSCSFFGASVRWEPGSRLCFFCPSLPAGTGAFSHLIIFFFQEAGLLCRILLDICFFYRPVIDRSFHNRLPFSGSLCIFQKSSAEFVFIGLIRNCIECPGYGFFSGVGPFHYLRCKRVARNFVFCKCIIRRNPAKLVDAEVFSCLAVEQPVDESKCCFLVFF